MSPQSCETYVDLVAVVLVQADVDDLLGPPVPPDLEIPLGLVVDELHQGLNAEENSLGPANAVEIR